MTWGLVASAGATIIGGVMSSRSAGRAADAQRAGADAASAEQRRQYEQTRGDLMPYMQLGTSGMNGLNQLNSGDLSGFANSPDNVYQRQQMQAALENGAAARGRVFSGGFQADMAREQAGLASQQLGTYRNYLQSLVGGGQNAAAGMGGFGQNMANQIGQNAMAAGNARASGYLSQGNAANNTLGQLGQFASSYFGGRNAGGVQPMQQPAGYQYPSSGTTQFGLPANVAPYQNTYWGQ